MGDLANRIAKNLKHLSRWARREGVSCYRVYDHDIPEHPVRVDLYRCQAGLYALVYLSAEHRDPAMVEEEVRSAVAPQAVILKERGRRPGGAPLPGEGRSTLPPIVIEERGLKFEAHLDGAHDTGLFLDHREARRWVRQHAGGRHVLNLFCYTGSFSIYAAAAGARVTSVDMSRTYLDWLERNAELNGQSMERRHQLVQADVLRTIGEGETRYDLIVCDPPTFSNSKRMAEDFEVRRDQVRLVEACRRRLAHPGTLLFSVNDRSFRLDPKLAEDMVDVSSQTQSEDCRRRPSHRSWMLHLDRAGTPSPQTALPAAP